MQLTTWRPFQEMDEFFRRVSPSANGRALELFDSDGHNIAEWSPSADISESKKEYLVKAELPDVNKEDIHVSVSDGTLTIKGERKHQKDEEDEKIHRVESFYGQFTRSFSLPGNADESKIKAECKKGVLRVHIPKSAESPKEQSVEIKVT